MGLRRAILLAGVGLLIGGCGGDSGDSGSAESAGGGETTTGSEPVLPEPIPLGDAAQVKLEDRLKREISIPDEPDWMVEAFGSLWTIRGNGDVLRLDPGSGRIIATIENPFGFKPPLCQGIGASKDSIWACPANGNPGGTVVRIDPDKNEVVSTLSTRKIPEQGRLLSAAGRLWLLTDSGEKLTGIDLETEKPTAELDLGSRCTQLASQPPDQRSPVGGLPLRRPPPAHRSGGPRDHRRAGARGCRAWLGGRRRLGRLRRRHRPGRP